MTTNEIRAKFLEFFKQRGHTIIPRAKLVPENDPTTLFTGSGMQPMVPYLLGEQYPGGVKRIADSQPVFRTVDLDEVGDSEHFTNFEMLGNWSLGDYYKQEQIPWMAEFLFDVVQLDPQKVYVSCYIGNKELGIPKDTESIELWKKEFGSRGIEAKVVELGSASNGDKQGMQGGRIFLYDGKENWWSRGGDEAGTPVGDPCGPDSEMFYDFGEQYHDEKQWGKAHPASSSPRFFEIGNNVFMGYKKSPDSKFIELGAPNIDQGAGLERLAAASMGEPDMFKIDSVWPIIEKLESLSGKSYESDKQALQVVSDHLKGAYWLAVDGVIPSNKEQGYVMRRLMRRAVRFALELGIENDLVKLVVPIIRQIYGEAYPEIAEQYDHVVSVLEKEEKAFRQTLKQGLKHFVKVLEIEIVGGDAHFIDKEGNKTKKHDMKKVLTGKEIFMLFDTHGFPPELSLEEAASKKIPLEKNWEKEYQKELEAQRDRSRTATKGMFKGGLAEHSEQTIKYHTATHMMYRALRTVLGDHVEQRGSNITNERLRFDFNHPEKVTPEQQKKVEDIVNKAIKDDLPVSWKEMPTKEALATGARGHFGEKYGEKVKVYTIGDPKQPYTMELCGGPHVEHTGALGEGGKQFKIIKEEANAAGIRRIKAVLE